MKKRFIYFLPIFLFLVFLGLKCFNPEYYNFIIQEDHLVEWGQFFFFLITSGVFFIAFLKTIKTNRIFGLIYLFLALSFFFVSGEEISWGQRLLGFETPESIEKRNFQDELTFHNIGEFHVLLHFGYMIIGALGATLWLLPKKLIRSSKLLKTFIPDWSLTFYFLLTALVYTLIWVWDEQRKINFIHWKDQEPVELLFSMAFLIYSVRILFGRGDKNSN